MNLESTVSSFSKLFFLIVFSVFFEILSLILEFLAILSRNAVSILEGDRHMDEVRDERLAELRLQARVVELRGHDEARDARLDLALC